MAGKIFRAFFVALVLLLLVAVPAARATPPVSGYGGKSALAHIGDNPPDPLTTKQRELKQVALEAKLNGKARGKTMQVARGQYVELAREGEAAVWTVLGEFVDFPHNSIAQPDRAVDNSTIWEPDFNRSYYMKMLFNDTPGANSMRNYYVQQSAKRFTVHGDVTDWVPVPGNAADYTYPNPDPSKSTVVWNFIRDSVNGWYAAQKAAGKTEAEINAYLSQFDKYDPYDYNHNGNFNEPDGYIDVFQSVHAGQGQEAGGGALGTDAIWSHDWYAYYNLIGTAGPDFNKAGGTRIGNSSYWVGKYSIMPENGGVGVFCHEFGHTLGLPDLYDTSTMGLSQNGTGYWSLMAMGSWLSDGTVDVGSKPSHMGAWEKFQLGWLNYQVASAGQKAEFKLGPMEYNTKQAQGLFVVLPKKAVTTNIGAPYAGSRYYSSAGDKLDNLMYKSFSLTSGSTLTAKVSYSTELDYDYAYLVCSTDGGATWTPIETNLSTSTNPNGQNFGFGITGASGGWVDLSANLPSGNILLGFRYWTDQNTGDFGLMVDDINISGNPTDGAETEAGWTYKPTTGFHVTTGTDTAWYDQYYVAEYRTYKGYDSTLKTGPYVPGLLNDPTLFNLVARFPYQDGLLINYWDTSQKNNETHVHSGAGLILPIDAHYKTLYDPFGQPWDNRVQSYDSTFSLDPTDPLANLHWMGVPWSAPSLPPVKVFDDRTLYWDSTNPSGSVKNPNTGTQILIQSVSAQNSFMQVEVRPAK
jgi:immune inhibitor A